MMEEEQLRVSKKLLFWLRLLTVLVLIGLTGAIVLLAWFGPTVLAFVTSATQLMSQVEVTTANLDELIKTLNRVDFVQLAENINTTMAQSGTALEEALKAVGEALKTLSSINIQELNEGIANLNSVVEPLAKLFGR